MARLHEGMGQAVAERTILRQKFVEAPKKIELNPADPNFQRWYQIAFGSGVPVIVDESAPATKGAPARDVDYVYETWEDVARRVSVGNVSVLDPDDAEEIDSLFRAIDSGVALMSGRHMQHGDATQPDRSMMVFTNCATAANSFGCFYLLLNGSGVGRAYDDDMMLVDWDYAPNVQCVISADHRDFQWGGQFLSTREAKHRFDGGKKVHWFEVPDSREGWAKAVEFIESMAYQKIYHDNMVVLDFSEVRPAGSPIKGMQGRPSSGPIPLMSAIHKMMTIKGAGMAKWKQAMYIDHYLAECVLVGGARRAARMSTKWWKDADVLDYVQVKRPIEYIGLEEKEVFDHRRERVESGLSPHESFLWTSNNSVVVDEEFWHQLSLKRGEEGYATDLARLARKLYQAVIACSYGDGTGEPGFINSHHLRSKDDNLMNVYGIPEPYMGFDGYQVHESTEMYLRALSKRLLRKQNKMIVNPCGEIPLILLGGFCVIGDLAPFMADSFDEVLTHGKAMVRALIRTNLMKSIYQKEVRRTNRIGISITGVHEWAWKSFGLTFRDMLDDEGVGMEFWQTVAHLSRELQAEAERYSKELGLPRPHTAMTVKPSGTVSKWFGLTEGWHLPSMKMYLRWVSFRSDSDQVEEYRAKGYPVRELKTYAGQTIVGFPTVPKLSEIMPDDKIVTAAEATPEEQFEWLLLGERYWLKGGGDGDMDGQISYTLKYKPTEISFDEFNEVIGTYQKMVKCCSVMPQEEIVSYEYQPEEMVTKGKFEEIVRTIDRARYEDVSFEHVDCSGGACPVDFNEAA